MATGIVVTVGFVIMLEVAEQQQSIYHKQHNLHLCSR